ncbi:hypothetical protein [Altererythrobacter sp. GH1-8]|uniref:hypothetical protein n=1 Tax=Altererythrobacter sp. GH1-8 TaxID=3349333 RepID=UPI00374D638E
MQIYSYGPCQPQREFQDSKKAGGKSNQPTNSRIPRAREKRVKRNNTRAGQWGGARNRKDRITTALKQEHAEGILRAIAVAELKGMPLNRFWTVNYEWAGIDDSEGAAFIGRLLQLCQRYARAREGSFAAVWVREIGPKNGAHVHIAFHLPSGWRLSGPLIRKWIKQAGGRYSAKVSDMRPIGGSLQCAVTNPSHYWANAEAMANYMVKGSADAVADELGLSLRKWGGRVIGKRWGRTQNLGG